MHVHKVTSQGEMNLESKHHLFKNDKINDLKGHLYLQERNVSVHDAAIILYSSSVWC